MTSGMQHVIETERLLLRPMYPDDAGALLAIFADPVVMASFNEAPFSLDQMQKWLGSNLVHQTKHGYGLFAVILKSENELIGDCGLEYMEVGGESIVELGYDFRSAYWGCGYAPEAALAVRDFAFQTLGLPRLRSLIRVGNHASRRVAEKVGMNLLEDIVRNNRPYWIYGIDRLPS